MEIINNRYRIINNLKQNRLCSIYEAIDIQKGCSIVKLHILNSKYTPKDFINFCTLKFESLGSINNANSLEVFEFGVVKQVDNKKAYNKTYYFTTEFIEDNKKIVNSVENISEENLILYFVNICIAINYFWKTGKPYSSLNIDNIFVKDNDFGIKLKDPISTELENYEFSLAEDFNNLFVAPECYEGEAVNIGSQIYSLGIILIILILKSKLVYENKKQVIEIVNILNSDSFLECSNILGEKLISILINMVSFEPEKRYNSLEELIADINLKFSTSYIPYNKNEFEKLNFDIRMIGREEEISSLLAIKDSIFRYDLSKKVATVHGEIGSGKSRLLKYINYILCLKEENVFISLNANKASEKYSNKLISDILKQIIPVASKELVNKYLPELVKFVPELSEKKNIITSYVLKGNKEKYRIISKIASFLSEYFSDKQGIIIIDDLDKADEFTLEFLFYLVSKYNKATKVMILFSYCDGQCLENKKFMDFLDSVRDNVKLELLLKPLNNIQTGYMIKDILNMNKILVNFTEAIYKHTMGNPLFIQETLKDLFARKMIYIDDSTGKWYKEDEKFSLPENMYEAYKNQIEKLDKLSCGVLNIISIFENPISIEVIGAFIPEPIIAIQSSIDKLITNGILCKKIEDRGFVFEFYNRFLKTFIYDNIEVDEKKKKHSFSAEILKKYYEEDDSNYISEVIYHLEKSQEYDKLLYYYLENAEIMINLKNRSGAISSLIRAVTILDEHNLDNTKFLLTNKLNLLIRVGDLYNDEGDTKKALEYYLKAEEISDKGKCRRKQVDIIFKIIKIISLRDEDFKIESYLEKAKFILGTFNYDEGRLDYLRVLCTRYFNEQKYEEAYKLCLEGIKLSGEKHIKHKVAFNSLYCNLLIVQNRIEEALKSLEISLEQCKAINYHAGIIRCVNNLGLIYSDYLQNNEEALKYFKQVYELSKENNDVYDEIVALSNIGFTYYMLKEYDTSYDYFIKAINKSKKYDFNNMAFYVYTYLGNIFYKFGNYGEAYKYCLLCEDQLVKWPNQGQEIGPYYVLAFRINLAFSRFDKALEFLEKANKVYVNSSTVFKWELETLNIIAKVAIHKSSEEDICCELINVSEKITDIEEKLSILYESIIYLWDLGFVCEAKEILKYIEQQDFKTINNRNLCSKLYINTLLFERDNIDELILAIELCKKNEQANLLWKIYSLIGDYYNRRREYSYAASYYFEACGVIADLVLQIPREFRVKFINSNNMIRSFEKFNNLEFYFQNTELNNSYTNEIIISSEGELEQMFNSLYNNKMLKNKNFVKSLKRLWSFSLQEDIQDFEGVINKLSSNSVKNMELIAQYLCYITLATKACVIVETNKKFQVLASSNKDIEMPKDISIIQKCQDLLAPIITKDNYMDNIGFKAHKMATGNIKAAMCIPIIMDAKIDLINGYKRDTDVYHYNDNILGYIYIESERILNNINKEILQDCITISKILGITIEKYNTKISSTIDKLTGTITRKQLEKLIQYEIDRSNENNFTFSLLMFDIDKFKDINDTFGHRTGDKVLSKLCEIVMSNIRNTDVIGRYGGEEFIVILPETDIEGAELVAEKVRKKIESSKILGDKREVTISLGISNYPNHTVSYEELIEKADQALYAAKNSGRNAYKVWNESYSFKGNTTNKLSGILTGSTHNDFRNVSNLIEVVDLINENDSFENKIFNILGKIMEITDCESVGLFLTQNGKIKNNFIRQQSTEQWCSQEFFNENIIYNAINTGENICSIDWDNINDFDTLSVIPDWKSIMVIPLKRGNKVMAVLGLSVSSQIKEFNGDELNFISTIGKIITPIL